jgi:hypothetical protein
LIPKELNVATGWGTYYDCAKITKKQSVIKVLYNFVYPKLADGKITHEELKMNKCIFCNEDIQDDAKVCKHCGKNQTIPENIKEGKHKSSRALVILGIFIFIASGIEFYCGGYETAVWFFFSGGIVFGVRGTLNNSVKQQRKQLLGE